MGQPIRCSSCVMASGDAGGRGKCRAFTCASMPVIDRMAGVRECVRSWYEPCRSGEPGAEARASPDRDPQPAYAQVGWGRLRPTAGRASARHGLRCLPAK